MEKYVDVKGVKIYLVEKGEGEVIVFLHGFPESHYSWRHQLDSLSTEFRCIAPDMKGFGRSEKPRKGYEIHMLSEDIYLLAENLSLKKFVLCGHDWGGVIAWDFAYRFPEKVKGLIIMNAPHPLDYIREVFTNPSQFLKSWYVFFFQIPFVPEALLSPNNCEPLIKLVKASIKKKDCFREEDVDVLRREISREGALKCGISYYRNAIKSILKWRNLYRKKISIPIAVIWGKHDAFLSYNLARRAAEKTEKKCVLKVIEEAGHWVQQEAPREVTAVIEEFVKSL